MLSKEEIENSFIRIETICKKEVCLFNQPIIEGNLNQIKRYIIQLESDKQKLIKKLEEIIKETSQNINPEAMKKYQNLKMEEINDETYILLAMHRIGFAGEILEIVKGENNGRK